jgi:peptidoglycan/xylan/chitin deacetylase (PgdA/CDA1 family)
MTTVHRCPPSFRVSYAATAKPHRFPERCDQNPPYFPKLLPSEAQRNLPIDVATIFVIGSELTPERRWSDDKF